MSETSIHRTLCHSIFGEVTVERLSVVASVKVFRATDEAAILRFLALSLMEKHSVQELLTAMT